MKQITRFLVLAACLVPCASAPAAEPIRHKFLLMDESRHQLHYVDEADMTKCWKVSLGASRDLQLIGGGKVMVSNAAGYSIYDLATRRREKELTNPVLDGTTSVRRRSDGTTLIGANQKGIAVFLLDKDDKIARKAHFPTVGNLRLLRQTPEGTVLLAEEKGVTEAAFDDASADGGRIVRHVKLPHGRNVYMALKTAAGNYLVAGGYAHAMFEQKPDGTPVRTFEAAMPQGMTPLFYAGFQVLGNGHVVVSHWTGHGPQDSGKGWQLVEFDRDGKPAWKWHNPELAGTAHGVIVLDGIDPQVLNDDSSGILGPVAK